VYTFIEDKLLAPCIRLCVYHINNATKDYVLSNVVWFNVPLDTF